MTLWRERPCLRVSLNLSQNLPRKRPTFATALALGILVCDRCCRLQEFCDSGLDTSCSARGSIPMLREARKSAAVYGGILAVNASRSPVSERNDDYDRVLVFHQLGHKSGHRRNALTQGAL